MFNCKMTEEPTMATAEEAAQRVYAKNLLLIDKVRKESVVITGNINDDRDTGTQLQRGRRGHRRDI